MLRLILIQLALFLTPFALWFLYTGVIARQEARTGGRFNERPWHILTICGGVLVLLGFIVFAFMGGSRGDTVYIPAHVENGRVVPGRYISREEAGDLANVGPRQRANPAPPGAGAQPGGAR